MYNNFCEKGIVLKIVICLSTYNGANYLNELLSSIEKTSLPLSQIELLVRDDGSTDASYEILQNFIQDSALHIKILEDRTNLGVKKSFELLMNQAIEMNAQYIMFCDQDDVWYSDKIEKTLSKMEELEGGYTDFPFLAHGNMNIVNEKLDILATSFLKYQHIDSNKKDLSYFIVDNNITGCTMMINRVLAEKVQTIPNEAIMHDWWIAMVASAFGKIAYVDEPLMLYRQHSSNDTGAKRYGFKYFIKKLFEKPSFEKYIQQSQAFLSLYGDDLDKNSKSMLKEFSKFSTLGKWAKIKILFKYKIWKNGFMRNLGLIFFA